MNKQLKIGIIAVIAVAISAAAIILNTWGFWLKNEHYRSPLAGKSEGLNPAVENFVSPIPVNPDFSEGIAGAILPHHLLVQGFLESFYSKIAGQNYYDEIILISPNHFGYGFNYIQTSDKIDGHTFNFDLEGIKELQKSGVVFNEPKLYAREHGIWTQETYLAKYFPSAKVVPLIIKEKTPQEKLDKLVEAILQIAAEKKQAGQKVLIIASLDFSHYSSENASLENDRKTVNWLKKIAEWPAQESEDFRQKIFKEAEDLGVSADKNRKGTVGADSPESIYVFAQLMKGLNTTKFSLWNRTSTIALVPGTPDASNTSHLFVTFK